MECTKISHHTSPTFEDKVLPLLKGELDQRVLTTPNLRQETGPSCTEDFRCLDNTRCHPEKEENPPNLQQETGGSCTGRRQT
ncbi:hypothetical protein E2C01_018264 [Portunus trituberculatus]|uniref:Uncharacterized protein n=1 Tax=Portunus trituberculatus TaxID=210409 RepID=A0A5B7DVY5_PORTR|nr:hypothetical protein [Portunus trituberculatus]